MKWRTTLTLTLLWTVLSAMASDKTWLESKRRIDHICELYNHDLNDSLISQAPRDMEFHKAHQLWEHYYETWTHLVNTHTFCGRVNTALSEVKRMHADATERNNHYGMALAYYAMGNAYINMGYLDESIDCYRQSLALIQQMNLKDATTVNDIYSYYCDALNEQKNYTAMPQVTRQWRAFLEQLTLNETEANKRNSNVWWAYYHLACAQMNLGMKRADEAEHDIDMAEKLSKGNGEFIPMSVLYYKAELELLRKDYSRAYTLNSMRLEKSHGFDDKSSLVLIYKQRAKILNGLKRYEEEADMYHSVYELTDSIYKKDTRTQINELNTLFRVSELNKERQLQHNRIVTLVSVVIALALALLVAYWYWMNRRLRRKNEELAVARDQAQESSRMKSDFIKNISHEIRTPLNILSGFSQIMAQPGAELPDDIRKEASQKIQENTDRITSLINRLLALSESSSRNYIERTDTVSVNQLCQTAISQSGIGEQRRCTFHFSSELADDFTLLTAEHYAEQAIGHLLDNAMKFTPDGGTIGMHCTATDKLVVVSVQDTGCGVPADKADTIFEEFVQLDEFKEGIGIGLPLSRNIIRRLGGDIVLDTDYQHGARFVLTLPRTETNH